MANNEATLILKAKDLATIEVRRVTEEMRRASRESIENTKSANRIAQDSARATSRIQIDAARSAQRVVEQGAKSAAFAARQAESAFNQARQAALGFVAAYASFNGLRALVGITDQYANLQAKIRIATKSVEEFNTADRQTYEIAQRTFTSLEATVTLYARLTASLEKYGVSQNRVAGLTETINKSLTVSGATAAESESAIIQLSQAFGAGALRGQEFNSVNEAAPLLMQKLADALGVPRGALKGLAAEGALTTEVLVAAFEEQAASISASFDEIPLTTTRALTQMQNAGTVAFGKLFGDGNLALANFLGGFVPVIEGLPEYVEIATYNIVELFRLAWQSVLTYLALVAPGAKQTWNALTEGAREGADGIRLLYAVALDAVTKAFAALVGSIGSALSELGGPLGSVAGKGLELLSQSIAASATNTALATVEIKANAAARDDSNKAIQGEINLILANDEAKKAEIRSLGLAYAATRAQESAAKAAAAATTDESDAHRKTAKELLAEALARGSNTKATNAAKTASKNLLDIELEMIETRARLITAEEKETAAKDAARKAVEGIIPAIEKAYELDGLTIEQRRIAEAGIKAEAYALKILADEKVKLLGLSPEVQSAIVAEAKARGQALEAAQIQTEAATEANKKAAEEYARYWDQAFDSVIDAAFQGGDALKNTVKNILLDIAKMFAKKFILQIGASVSGGGGISGLIGSLFGGAGKAGKGGPLGAITSQAGSGSSAGLLGGLSQIPVAGWIAAAIAVNAQLYQSGWRPQGGTVEFGNGGSVQGGGIGGGILRAGIIPGGDIALIVNGALNRIGVNPRVSSFLTGAALLTRLFGRKAPELVSQTNTINAGSGSAGGNISANILERGGLFRSNRNSTASTGLTPELQAQADQMRAAISAIATRALAQLTDSISSDITGSFVTVQDKTGKVTEEYVEVLGVKYKESVEQGIKRIGAENIFAELATITGTSLQSFAAGFRGNADALLDAAQALALAQSDIKAGDGFAIELADIAELLKTNTIEGDSLVETYGRIKDSVTTLRAALTIMDIDIDKSSVQFAQFALDIATAAGGTQQAAQLWESYFKTFYDSEELALSAVNQANFRRTAALQAIGLDANTTAEQFRETFERLLPTLTPEQIVQWLRAGAAIGAAADAQDAYNAVLTEGADAAEAAGEKLRGLADSLRTIEQQIDAGFIELERSGFTDFERSLLSINDNLQATTASLLEQRAAAVAAGASAQTLARYDLALGRAQLLAAAQAAAAIEKLRKAARSLIDQLYGKGAKQFSDSGTQAFQDIGDAAQSVYESQLNSIKTIQDYLDGQLLGGTSTLTPVQQFDEAQRQFNAAILAGNAQEATRLADVLLRLGQGRFASSQPYTDLEATVRAALQGLLGSIGQPVGPTGAVGTGGQGSPEEFDAAARENRLELALQLSEIVRDLLLATGDSLAEVAASIGLNMTKLVTDLGVNLTDLSVGTASSLATIAQSLGVELSELAENVGVDLGDLSDSQSLINGALKAAIDKLPVGQRDALKELLTDVEEAARTGGPDEINRAIGALETRVNLIGGATASALAPFFTGVNPVDPLNSIDSAVRALYQPGSLLDQINAGIAELVRRTALPQPETAPPIAAGNSAVYVPSAVVPGPSASSASVPNTEGNTQVVEQLKRTVLRLESLEATVRSGTTQQVRATVGVGETIVSATDKRQPVKPKLVMSE